MAGSNKFMSFLNTGLTSVPEVADPGLFNELTKIYNAINLIAGTLDTVQTRVGVKFAEELSVGELVYLFDDAGIIKAGKATSTSSNKFCMAYNLTDKATVGSAGEVCLLGYCPFYSGLTAGTLYYLSSTPGRLTATPGTGIFTQSVGFAISASEIWFNPSLTLYTTETPVTPEE